MTITPNAPKTLSERLDDLTGLDEIAIEDHFGRSVYDDWEAVLASLPTDDQTGETSTSRVSVKHMGRLKRMLLFVEKQHELPGKTAFGAVMGMTLREVNEALRLDELEDDAEGADAGTDDAPVESPEGKADEPAESGAA